MEIKKINHPVIIGLTGSIATGKSTVAEEFRKFGSKIIDSDKIAHKIILKRTEVYKKILKVFGKGILNSKGKINRKKLAKIVFSNPEKRKQLEKITHPVIISEIKTQLGFTNQVFGGTKHLVIVDVPLLFESKLTKIFDKILLVCIPKEIQIKRLMKRNKITRKEAVKLIATQMPLSQKKRLSDFVIDSSKPLKRQIKNVYENIFFKIT